MTNRMMPIKLAGVFALMGLGVMPVSGFAGELAIVSSIDDPALEWRPCPPIFAEGCEIASLHGDPSEPNSDVFFRMPGHYEFPAHLHSSAERMVLLSGTIKVTYEDQPEFLMQAGTYAYGPAIGVHYGSCISDEPCVLFITFEGPVDVMQPESE